MKIKLVRHGETEWNKEKRLMGWKNSPLTEKGISQAKEAAKKLKNDEIDLVISSDLGRAVQTAEIIAKELEVEVLKSWLIRERYNGKIEGLLKDDFDRPHVNKNPEEYCVELVKDLDGRAETFIHSLKSLPIETKTIVIVSHNRTLNSLISVLDKDHEIRRLDNAEIIEFEI